MQSAPARGRRGLAGLVAVLILSAIWFGQPGTAVASTESSMESTLRTLLNNDRTAHGLVPLRKDARLDLLSGDRATWMATQGLLTHDSADGSICNAMSKRSIFWYRCGEDIGFTTATWGNTAARFIYNLWKHSAPHWSLMMSNRYNYLGVGVARRTNGTTYASLVFLEGPDRTRPTARMQTHSRSGTTVHFSWSGADVRLQTHTAGLQDFNVAYRVDFGPYIQIRTGTTRTSLTLYHRAHGHWYTVRVQSRDRRGNLSFWSHGVRVWVP